MATGWGTDEEQVIVARLLGHRLRDARIAAEVQLPEAAHRVGTGKSYLSQCERGERIPSLAVLRRIADAYGLLTTDLLRDLYPFDNRERPSVPPPPEDGRRRSQERSS